MEEGLSEQPPAISILQPELQVSVPDIWRQLETAAHSIGGMANVQKCFLAILKL